LVAGELIKDNKEQKVIQLMMKYWSLGHGFAAIAKSLNHQKIKPRVAKIWDGGTVRKIILKNQKK
jgi:hypothetical protein